MSEKELKELQETLQRLDREARETDVAVENLKQAAAAADERGKKLDEQADRVQRRLAHAS